MGQLPRLNMQSINPRNFLLPGLTLKMTLLLCRQLTRIVSHLKVLRQSLPPSSDPDNPTYLNFPLRPKLAQPFSALQTLLPVFTVLYLLHFHEHTAGSQLSPLSNPPLPTTPIMTSSAPQLHQLMALYAAFAPAPCANRKMQSDSKHSYLPKCQVPMRPGAIAVTIIMSQGGGVV